MMSDSPGTARTADAPVDGRVDEALERIHTFGSEFKGALTSHAPMVAEVLERIDRADTVPAWVSAYERKLAPVEQSSAPVDAADFREALGAIWRFADWTELFTRELSDAPWPAVVSRWVPVLAPGVAAAATHGLIRTAHAVRLLERADTPPRRAELARGLAYWAARYQETPTPAVAGALSLLDALGQVPPLPDDAPRGLLIFDQIRHVDRDPFVAAVGRAGLPADPRRAVTALVDVGARMLVTNAAPDRIPFVHAVTGPAALRVVIPYLDGDQNQQAATHAWTVSAAIWSAYGHTAPAVELETEPPSWSTLVEAAMESGDEHDLKLVSTASEEVAAGGDDQLLRAATAAAVLPA
jgi:hypothetical protein